MDEFQSVHNKSPDVDEIALKFGVERDDVIVALDSAKLPLSIYDKFEDDEDGQQLIDKIPSDYGEEKLLNKIHLKGIINNLSDREQKIIILRYFRDKTQTEIAESLGVSQVQVSRLENKIIEKMRLKF